MWTLEMIYAMLKLHSAVTNERLAL